MLEEKYKRLREIITTTDNAIVAFSGGVDSSLVAKVSLDTLGKNAIAVTVNSPVLPRRNLESAKRIAGEIGIRHIIAEIYLLEIEKFVENPMDRCYYCKKSIIRILKRIAGNINATVILDGTNADDMKKNRSGLKALQEEGILSPLAEANFTKNDVRKLARNLNLSNSEQPPESCLATRIPYNNRITNKELKRIENAENYIHAMGVKLIRVRNYGEIAIIEILPEDFNRIIRNRASIMNKFKELGFRYSLLNLNGYTQSIMNIL